MSFNDGFIFTINRIFNSTFISFIIAISSISLDISKHQIDKTHTRYYTLTKDDHQLHACNFFVAQGDEEAPPHIFWMPSIEST